LTGAQEAKAIHTAGHDADVASAFRASLGGRVDVERRARRLSIKRPARLAAAGLLALTAVAVALAGLMLIGRRRD
jgi:hypothetical protein